MSPNLSWRRSWRSRCSLAFDIDAENGATSDWRPHFDWRHPPRAETEAGLLCCSNDCRADNSSPFAAAAAAVVVAFAAVDFAAVAAAAAVVIVADLSFDGAAWSQN